MSLRKAERRPERRAKRTARRIEAVGKDSARSSLLSERDWCEDEYASAAGGREAEAVGGTPAEPIGVSHGKGALGLDVIAGLIWRTWGIIENFPRFSA